MTPDQHSRLVVLADYLDDLAPDRSGPAFDMLRMYSGRVVEHGVPYPYWPEEVSRHDGCNAVACALGHAARIFAGVPEESWSEYSLRVLGVHWGSPAACWMFDQRWSCTDNTPGGAAARIRIYLDRGLPTDWAQQMVGAVPLRYVREEKLP